MRKKTTGQPNNSPNMNVIVSSPDVKTLVTSSGIINIKDGEKVFYLSVPFDNDWEKLEIKGPVKFDSRNFVNHYCVPKGYEYLLEYIVSQIKGLLGKLSKNPDELWHINVTYPTRIRTLKVDKIEKPNEVSGQLDKYPANSFANEQDAVDMLNKIYYCPLNIFKSPILLFLLMDKPHIKDYERLSAKIITLHKPSTSIHVALFAFLWLTLTNFTHL